MNFLKIAIFAVIAVAVIIVAIRINSGLDKKAQENAVIAEQKVADEKTQIMDKFKIEDVAVGEGADKDVVRAGDQVTIDYEGTLDNGTKFDSSYDRKEPLSFTLGAGQVIPGFDRGVTGMKPEGVRNITIPPELGYGSRAMGAIPPNSTLHFKVELKSFLRMTPVGNTSGDANPIISVSSTPQ